MEQLNEFIVFVREVWIQPVKVKAMSLAQAVQRVENGEGETIESGFELSHSLEPEYWTAEDGEGNQYYDLTEIKDEE